MKVSAVIVTRGDVDLGPVLRSIEADEIVIRRGHGGVWERWEAAQHAVHDVIYTQDDDCVVDFAKVVGGYEPGKVLCNMLTSHRGEYPDGLALVGWGCVFHRDALRVFEGWPRDEIFRREADRVFTGMNALKLIDIGVTHLPHATSGSRMGREGRHGADLREIRRRIYQARQS